MTQQDARARAVALFDENDFDIVGPISINYSSTSSNGRPRLSYHDAKLDLNLAGDEITRVETSVGELVTVAVENSVDEFIRTFTLIVPSIKTAHKEEIEFETVGIETTDRSSAFMVPAGSIGVLQTYRFHQLHGTQTLDF